MGSSVFAIWQLTRRSERTSGVNIRLTMNIRSFALAVIAISLAAHQLAIADGRIEYLGRDLEMNEIRSDTYAGTVIVLAFWAT
jgi:hypothetical protein